jgi:predicted phosphodiesterase
MRIAIVSDVHGNYPALLAVINDAIENKVDHFLFVGDYIFDLPYPNEVTELIRGLKNAFIIKGNKENQLKNLSKEDQNNWNVDQMGAVYQTYRELKPENYSYLTNLDESCYISLPFHGRIYAAHFIKDIFDKQKNVVYSSSRFKTAMQKQPFSHEQFLSHINMMLANKNTCNIISDIDASVIVFGHTHLQHYGYCGDTLIINPGSCGQPLDFNIMASYSILEDTPHCLCVEEKRVRYDIEQTIQYSRTSEIYKRGSIWCELVFLAMRTGADCFADFFELAERIAKEKNDMEYYFSNETWDAAGKVFFKRSGAYLLNI